ncbi:MAG: response regulator [Clostridiales bacterium]|jgi:signal transduction histidine kinase/FixJ family two-component response regulator|nr:response regulator [Clostridiales bacterium]
MSVRIRIICIIIVIVFSIVSLGMTIGLFFMQRNLTENFKADLNFASQIADDVISSKLYSLEKFTLVIADNLKIKAMGTGILEGKPNKAVIEAYLKAEIGESSFMSVTIFDREGAVASYGESAASSEYLDTEYAANAWAGERDITSTREASDGNLVFYMFAPVNDSYIMAAAIPGDFFAKVVSKYNFLRSGGIYMLDENGKAIADAREGSTNKQINIVEIERASSDPRARLFVEHFEKAKAGENGYGEYVYEGVSRAASYSLLSGSESARGWTLWIAMNMDESSVMRAREGLTLTIIICMVLSIAVAIFAANHIAKYVEKSNKLDSEVENTMNMLSTKNRFFANMSHEMRTPLNVIIGFLEMLVVREDLPDDVIKTHEKLYDSASLLLNLINDLLDISKMEASKFELRDAPYDTVSMVNDILTLNAERAQDRPIEFNLEITEDFPTALLGDEMRVKQVFNNLLTNAFKYTRQGKIDWKISCDWTSEDWVTIKSSVSDTGVGIKEEEMKRLFSEYTRFEGSVGQSGTGLGLYIVKELLRLLNGGISVKSEFGRGSCFEIEIRQKIIKHDCIGPEVAGNLMNFQQVISRRNRKFNFVRVHMPYAHLLIVDDVVSNLDVAKALLRPYGAKIDCVTNGNDALTLIKDAKKKYTAVFLDHMMPGMDGIETLRKIRGEIDSDYARAVPIIALTANSLTGNKEMFLEEGFSDFISKPIDITELDRVMRRWVRDKNRKEEAAPPLEFTAKKTEPQKEPAAPEPELVPLDVPGLDFRKGYALMGEDMEGYICVLNSYINNTPEGLNRLLALQYTDIKEYGVEVHGIKGISYNIGATQIGDEALVLERAANAGDSEYIISETEAFVEKTRAFVGALARELNKNPVKERPALPAPDFTMLEKLKEACVDYDMDAVDEAMSVLESFKYDTDNELVTWLRAKVNAKDFEEINVRLKEYLK